MKGLYITGEIKYVDQIAFQRGPQVLAFIKSVVVFVLTICIVPVSAQVLAGNKSIGTEIYTPVPKLQPRINGPLVYGCRPGHPFLYRIPCQGERPIKFSVKDLPSDLHLDPSTGIITLLRELFW